MGVLHGSLQGICHKISDGFDRIPVHFLRDLSRFQGSHRGLSSLSNFSGTFFVFKGFHRGLPVFKRTLFVFLKVLPVFIDRAHARFKGVLLAFHMHPIYFDRVMSVCNWPCPFHTGSFQCYQLRSHFFPRVSSFLTGPVPDYDIIIGGNQSRPRAEQPLGRPCDNNTWPLITNARPLRKKAIFTPF